MKAIKIISATSFCGLLATSLHAATTIDPVNRYAYGANVGWINGYADGANGAVIGEYVCSGYLYAANVGWISLGSGAPPGGIYYTNTTADNWGVNQDGLGNLRGYAWGANIGWINFESTGAPAVDLATGNLTGYAYSANCGWISLSNLSAVVQTALIAAGTDSDHNGLPDAWELQNFGHLGVDPNADPDHDGMSNWQEYLAGTDPNNAADCLRITSYTRSGTYNTLWWTAKPTRLYRVERRPTVGPTSVWEELTLGLENVPGWSNVGFDNTGSRYFYGIRAIRPLTP